MWLCLQETSPPASHRDEHPTTLSIPTAGQSQHCHHKWAVGGTASVLRPPRAPHSTGLQTISPFNVTIKKSLLITTAA